MTTIQDTKRDGSRARGRAFVPVLAALGQRRSRAGYGALLMAGVLGWMPLALAGESVRSFSTDETQSLVPPPRLFPDYTGMVIPPNIAPLNFQIRDPGKAWRICITGAAGAPIQLQTKSGQVRIPSQPWRTLLSANRGSVLCFEISRQSEDGAWLQHETVTNTVAKEPLDSHLVYRLLRPAHSVYGELGIYQRDLESFEETAILENSDFDRGCVNCHTFNQNRPEPMALHIRLKNTGNPTLLWRSNQVTHLSKTAGYLSWHPSGRLLAYSSNRFKLFFHISGETRDVYDTDSDLGIYRVDENRLVVPAVLADPNRFENWPCWSADGRALYFCSAPKLRFERYDRIRYDLVRVSYDPEQDRWGIPETLLSSANLRKSVNEPRVSPDGRWLICCLLPYGNFPPYQPESDLYLLDLTTNEFRALDEINSDQVDSYASWSSSPRWVVFNSKRLDGVFSRPFFSYVDERGRFSKPLLLPQEDASFYDACIKNYNRPELITGPVTVRPRELVRGIFHPRQKVQPQGSAVPTGAADHPYEQIRRD